MYRFRSTYKEVDADMAKQYRQGLLKCLGIKPGVFQVSSQLCTTTHTLL